MSFNRFKIIALFCVLAIGLSSESSAQGLKDEKYIKVAMRMIGHQILLRSGDSTSRVLPIKKEGNTYKVEFESEFDFNPIDLSKTIDSIMVETGVADDYLVEVEINETDEVIYSYVVESSANSEVIPCAGREQPQNSYYLSITFLSKDSSAFLWSILLLIPVGLLFLVWKRKRKSPIDPDLIIVGKYQFDKRNMTLSLESSKVELSAKEADLLFVLYSSVNATLKREEILQKVWGDEGDYIGRTLDVFISKLRKKLEADPNVKIINSRGIGYKLVLNDTK